MECRGKMIPFLLIMSVWKSVCVSEVVATHGKTAFGIVMDAGLDGSRIIENLEKYFRAQNICPAYPPVLVMRQLNGSDRHSVITQVLSEMAKDGIQGVVSVLSPHLQNRIVRATESLKLPHVAVGEDTGQLRRPNLYTIYTSPEASTRTDVMISVMEAVVRENNWKSFTILLDQSFPASTLQGLIFHLTKLYVEARLLQIDSWTQDQQLRDMLTLAQLKGCKCVVVLATLNTQKRVIEQAESLDMLSLSYFWIFFPGDALVERHEKVYKPLSLGNALVVMHHWEPFTACCDPYSNRHNLPSRFPNNSVLEIKMLEALSLLYRTASVVSSPSFKNSKREGDHWASHMIEQLHESYDDEGVLRWHVMCSLVPPFFYRRQVRRPTRTIILILRIRDGYGVVSGFDASGNPRATMYDLLSTSKHADQSLSVIGDWTNLHGISLHKRFFLNKFVDFGGLEIPIAALVHSPFHVIEMNGNLSVRHGFIMDIVDELAKRLNFSYRIIEPPDNQYGALEGPSSNASWNGMVGMVTRGEVFMAAAPFTVTAERARVVEFSKSFMEISSSIISRKINAESDNLYQVFKPLPIEIWSSIAAAVVVVGFSCALINRCSPSQAGRNNPILSVYEESIWQNIWSVYSSLVDQGPIYHPASVSGRCIMGVWWVFSTLVVSMYTAVLAAFLTVTSTPPHIGSLSDLVAQSEIKVLLTTGSNTYSLFRDSKISTYQQVWEKFQGTPLVELEKDALELVRTGPYAFISDSLGLEWTASGSCGRFVVAEERFNKGSYAFILPKGAPYLDAINFNIMKIVEAGLVDVWWKKWTHDQVKCPTRSGSRQMLALNKLGGVFIIYIIVAGGAILIFLFRALWEGVLKRICSHS